eukprot:TRINITY_DN3258_c0_g1_i7.p1 TRINITY_DN3258_c0_g1~~TRINITY_DN3258_c0_g1_i7.p1  ORF type:complete len:338 (+),score=89.46 TRINITY_DN3258_c0_g1_i7:214-1227(+)
MHATHFFGGRYQSHHEMEEDEVKEKDLFDQYVDIHLKALDDLMRMNEKPTEMIERVVGIMGVMKNEQIQLAIARFLATIPPKELLPYLLKKIEEREEAEEDTETEEKERLNNIYGWAIKLAKERGDKEMMEILQKSKEGLTQGGDSYMSKECVEVLLSCLFDVKSEWCWTEIIEIFGEEGMREEHHPQVISALRHKLEVSDTEELEKSESSRGTWNGRIILSLINLAVKEDWMLGKVTSALQLVGRVDPRNILALFQCLSLLEQWNDDIMKAAVSVLERYKAMDEKEVLLEAMKLIERFADKNDETADHVLVQLLKHLDEEIRIVAGRILGSRRIHQ